MLHFNTLSLGNGSTYHGIYHFVQNYRLSLSSCKVVLFLLIINNLMLPFVFILLAHSVLNSLSANAEVTSQSISSGPMSRYFCTSRAVSKGDLCDVYVCLS